MSKDMDVEDYTDFLDTAVIYQLALDRTNNKAKRKELSKTLNWYLDMAEAGLGPDFCERELYRLYSVYRQEALTNG